MARRAGSYRSEKFRKEQQRNKKRQEKLLKRQHQKGEGPPIEAVELMPGMPGYGEQPAAAPEQEPEAGPATEPET